MNNINELKYSNNGAKLIIIIFFLSYIVLFYSSSLNLIKINKNYPKKKNIINKKSKLNLTHFISYSQCLEDLILYCIFYDIDKGFYIDVGANDPNKISVTKAFYLKGWNGINVEPLPDMFPKLMQYRSRDINLNMATGDKEDNLKLYVKGTGSTFNKQFSHNEKQMNIEVHTMSNICKKHIPKNKDIEFCKIDVEGFEKNVLLGYDFINYRPKVFCIESTFPGTFKPSYHEWEYILLKNGYNFGFQYIINRYYFDSNIDYLRDRFSNLNNYILTYKQIHKKYKKKHK